ncbi:MAG: hypothetical protein ABEN55_22815, partial [Bradymonadaceae bacterium]
MREAHQASSTDETYRGPARQSGQASLAPDVDYYLLSAERGQTLEVTVTPKNGSQLQPDLLMGWYFATRSRFRDFGGHRAPVADQPGDSRSITYLFNSRTDGEVAFRLRHAPNNSGDSPVGGQNYDYTISVESLSPSPTEISPVPGSATSTFGPGGIGLYKFD